MSEKAGKRILAVASGGGHWVQLLRLRPAFDGHHVEYLTTRYATGKDVHDHVHMVTDANHWKKLKLLRMFLEVAFVVLRIRPHVVITLGAAPGLAAIMVGKLLGARTIWLDSIANAEEVSKSGQMARRWADAWLTQWKDLARDEGPDHWGAVL